MRCGGGRHNVAAIEAAASRTCFGDNDPCLEPRIRRRVRRQCRSACNRRILGRGGRYAAMGHQCVSLAGERAFAFGRRDGRPLRQQADADLRYRDLCCRLRLLRDCDESLLLALRPRGSGHRRHEDSQRLHRAHNRGGVGRGTAPFYLPTARRGREFAHR